MNAKELYTSPSVEIIVLKTKQSILAYSDPYDSTDQTEKLHRDGDVVDL